MRICVIFNPTARGNQARRFRARLDRLTGACAFKPTTGPGAGTFLATEAVNEGFDTVVAAGGDGTVSEVVTGLAQAAEGLARCRLGILPLGTINVFARELALPLNLDGAWETVLQGRETRVDLPFAEFHDAAGERRRFFTQLAGAGLDSRAIAGVDWEWKKRIGWLAYVVAGLRALGKALAGTGQRWRTFCLGGTGADRQRPLLRGRNPDVSAGQPARQPA